MSKKTLSIFVIAIAIVVIFGCMNKVKDHNIQEEGLDGPLSEEMIAEMARGEVIPQDTDNWQVYKKESKNLLFRFHKGWYYARNSQKEVESEYDLYVGFADNPEILEADSPYPIEFAIVPADKREQYTGIYAYATGTEKNDKYYFFATNNRKAYASIVLAMARSLQFLDEEVMTEYRDQNVMFSYPKLWDRPYFQEGELLRPGTGQTAQWIITLGLEGRCSDKGGICPVFYLFGYYNEDKEAFLEGLRADESLEIETEKTINDQEVVIFTRSGKCQNISSYIFGPGVMVEIEAYCGGSDSNVRDAYNKILDSVVVFGQEEEENSI